MLEVFLRLAPWILLRMENGHIATIDDVRKFWQQAPCGEIYASGVSPSRQFEAHAQARFGLEPYIRSFAGFAGGRGRDVLEVGVGLGADHVEWAKADPRSLTGIDLTEAAVSYTRQRLAAYDLPSTVMIADAEQLPFIDESFDLVYSWGVLHHSPNTAKAVQEVYRVLRPQGTARIMVYHKYSIVGLMLFLRFGVLAGKPKRSLASIYADHLESPGTKAYTIEECRSLFCDFSDVSVRSQLSFGDLLEGEVGQRHRGGLLKVAKWAWPRWLLRRTAARLGLYLLIEASKGKAPATSCSGKGR